MVYIFNKQFRTREKIFNDLRKKIKKSETMTCIPHTDKYTLDTVVIEFKVIDPQTITINDKTGTEIIKLDCHYDGYDDIQKIMFHQFSSLLAFIRNQFDKRQERIKKIKEAEAKVVKNRTASHTKQKKQETLLNNALERLKGLNK